MERAADPARRDQDLQAWRPGRFEERIRRQWNTVRTEGLDLSDLEALTEVIHAKVGGDRAHIRHRLQHFFDIEAAPAVKKAQDPLVRPGARA